MKAGSDSETHYFDVTNHRDLKPGTVLFNLAPVGIGTPYAESLTGYLQRLSITHCLGPSRLREGVLSHHIPSPKPSWCYSRGAYERSSLNGNGLLASKMVDTLERLTSRTDLRMCTALPLRLAIYRGVIHRGDLRVCRQCLQSAGDIQNLVIPLLWYFRSVEVCPIHMVRLIVPRCDRPRRSTMLGLGQLLGVCPNCQSFGFHCDTSPPVLADASQLRVASQVGDLIGRFSQDEDKFTLENLKRGLELAMHSLDSGITSVSKRAGFSKSQVWEWVYGPHRPSFELLVYLCGSISFDLLSVLTGKPRPIADIMSRERPAKQKHVRRSLAEQRSLIEGYIARLGGESLEAVAAGTGVSQRWIRQKFPDLSGAISRRKRERDRSRRATLRAERTIAFKQAIEALRQRGESVSRRSLQTELKRAIYSGSTWHQLLLEWLSHQNRHPSDRDGSLQQIRT